MLRPYLQKVSLVQVRLINTLKLDWVSSSNPVQTQAVYAWRRGYFNCREIGLAELPIDQTESLLGESRRNLFNLLPPRLIRWARGRIELINRKLDCAHLYHRAHTE